MSKLEFASRNARTPEELTDAQKRRVEALVEKGDLDRAKKSQELTVAECIYGFRHEHKLKLGKVQRSAPQPAVTKPAPAVTAPSVTGPALSDSELEHLRRRAIAALA
jgi:hypothetical protein